MMKRNRTVARLLAAGAVCVLLLCALAVQARAGLGIVVRTPEGTEYAFDPEPTDRVEDLKAWLEAASGVPYAGIRLFFEGKELREGSSLQDCAVQRGSVLRMERKAAILSGVEALTGPRRMDTDQGSWQQPTALVSLGANDGAPILWRVLSDSAAADDGGANAVFLLAEQLQAAGVRFQEDGGAARWQGSSAQSWCKDFAATCFSSAESGAVLPATRQDKAGEWFAEPFGQSQLKGEQVFFLSAEELADRVGDYGNAPGLAAGGGWWLRSPCGTTDGSVIAMAGMVETDGGVANTSTDSALGARPALYLDGSKVLFASEAEGGKGSGEVRWLLNPVKEYGGGNWKLTLLDSSRSFSATASVPDTLCSGDTIEIKYSGFTPAEGEYISAALLDENGSWLYYGAISQGTESMGPCVILPDELQPGKYTLLLFSEQRRGNGQTDLASAPVEVELNVMHRHQWADTWTWDEVSHWHACLDPDCPAPGTKKDNTLHSFNKLVASQQYLVTAGGCTGPSTYYRSCDCGKAGEKTFTRPAPGHQPQKVEATAPTHTAAGNREYWYCAGCGGYFADEACTEPLTKEEVILPKLPASGGQTSGGGAAPAPTAAPAQTPAPAATPKPAGIPKPAATPKPAGTASPSPAPSATPVPAASAAPAASPAATAAPSPTPVSAQAAGGGFAPALLLVPAAVAAGGFGLWRVLAKRRNKGSE